MKIEDQRDVRPTELRREAMIMRTETGVGALVGIRKVGGEGRTDEPGGEEDAKSGVAFGRTGISISDSKVSALSANCHPKRTTYDVPRARPVDSADTQIETAQHREHGRRKSVTGHKLPHPSQELREPSNAKSHRQRQVGLNPTHTT